MSTPTPVVPVENEKSQAQHEHKFDGDLNIVDDDRRDSATKDDTLATDDNDDALKLVGEQAHQFDEKYFKRLKRKIVC